MFKKFLDTNPSHSGYPYVHVKFSWFEMLFFKMSAMQVDVHHYHTICKGNADNRAAKMSLFAHLTNYRSDLKFYRTEQSFYIMKGREGVFFLIE